LASGGSTSLLEPTSVAETEHVGQLRQRKDRTYCEGRQTSCHAQPQLCIWPIELLGEAIVR
jgi:hypothetical protein